MTPRPPSVFRRLREPRALNYLIMASVGFVVYGLMMSSYGNDAGVVIAALIATLGLLARWTLVPILVVLISAFLLIDPGFINLVNVLGGGRWFLPRDSSVFVVEDVLLASGLLAYIIGHYRFNSLIFQGMPDEPTVRRDVDPVNPPRRPAETVADDEWIRALVAGGITLVIGQVGWFGVMFVVRQSRPNATEFSVGTSRFLFVAWLTGVVLLCVSAALVYARTLRMSRTEAALTLRNEFFHENRRETDRLQRWRQWFKLRLASRRRSGKGD